MAMSLKDKIQGQLNTNNQEMLKAKEAAMTPEVKPSAKTTDKPQQTEENKTVAAVQKTVPTEKKTVKTETKAVNQPKPEKIIKKPATKNEFESWVNQTIADIDNIASDAEREYKPITVDVANWKFIDEIAKTLSTPARKITHNEYIELLIKKEVDEFNSLSEKEKDIVQATVDMKKRTNKTKTVGLRVNYWNAFDQLCIIHGHCAKCDLINLLIEKDIERNHPTKAPITKIEL